jgi:TPR repeat protein
MPLPLSFPVLLALAVLAGCGSRPRPAAVGDQTTLLVYAGDCDDNNGAACFELGEAYASGQLTPRDLHRATALLDRACTLHYEAACTRKRELRWPLPAPDS